MHKIGTSDAGGARNLYSRRGIRVCFRFFYSQRVCVTLCQSQEDFDPCKDILSATDEYTEGLDEIFEVHPTNA